MKKLLDKKPLEQSILIMRHGARPHITDPTLAETTMLTAEGIQTSHELGARLLSRTPVKGIFHSTIHRCQQTAQAILAGLEEEGSHPKFFGAFPELATPYLPDPQKTYTFAFTQGLDSLAFLRVWFTKGLDASLADEPHHAGWDQLNFLLKQFRENPGFQIHVSHDWNILLLLWTFLEVEPTLETWPNFLEGLLITVTPTALTLQFRATQKTLPGNWLPE